MRPCKSLPSHRIPTRAMAQKLNVPMPQDLDLPENWKLQVVGLSTTDGSQIANVTIDTILITGDSPNPEGLAYGPFMLVPGPGA